MQAFNWGIAAAQTAGINTNDYARHVVVVNVETDWGGVALGRSILLPDATADMWNLSRAAHEFGHALGLDDAFSVNRVGSNPSGPGETETRYNHPYCVMGYAWWEDKRFKSTYQGAAIEAGQGLNGIYVDALGGISPSRRVRTPAADFVVDVELEPLGQGFGERPVLVEIPAASGRERTSYVEFRRQAGWDTGIDNTVIFLSERRPNDGRAFIVNDGRFDLKQPSEAAMFTHDGRIGVRLLATPGSTARVRVWDIGPSLRRQVVIWQLQRNPPGDDTGTEFAVIRNNRAQTVELRGWSLRDEQSHMDGRPSRFVFPAYRLEPGDDVTVRVATGANTPGVLYWGRNSPIWNNRGRDAAVLEDPAGVQMDRISWG